MTSRRRATTVAIGLAALGLMAGLPNAAGAPASRATNASTASTATASVAGEVSARPTVGALSPAAGDARLEPAATGIVGTVSPFRMYDSRRDRPLAAGEVRHLCVSGTRVPNEAAAVVVNVTAVAPTQSGFLTAWNPDHGQPPVSTVNFAAGSVTSNLAVVELGLVHCVAVRNSSAGRTHVILDVQSFVMPGPATVAGTTQTIRPSRLLDTRTRVAVPSRGSITLQVAGRGGVPATGVGGAWLNLTATDATASGWVTVHPAGTPRPTASNLNFGARETRAGLTLAKLGANGAVTAYNGSSKPVHLVVDAFGWTRTGDATRTMAGVVPVPPTRLWDTRVAGALGRGEHLTLDRSQRREGAAAAILAVTAVGASSAGYLVVSANEIADNPTSAVNYAAGRASTNLVVARQEHDITVTNGSAGPVDVVVDLVGWVNGERSATGRVVDTAGRGVANAWVRDQPAGWPLVTSGTDGAFELPLRLGDDQLILCATASVNGEDDPSLADGCHPSQTSFRVFTLALGERVSGADVVLEPAGIAHGRATDFAGRPLSSAIVRLLRRSDGRLYEGSVVDGRWSIPRVAEGEYHVRLTHPTSSTATLFGLAGEWYPDIQVGSTATPTTLTGLGAGTLTVAPRTANPLDLVADAAAEISGTVKDADGTPPEAGAPVSLHHTDGTRFATIGVDRTTGTWSARVHPGSVAACAVRPFTGPTTCWQGNVPLEEATPITLTPGQSTGGIAITLP